MYCPESSFVCNKWVSIYHNGNGDIRWERRPIKERLNPLRWSLLIFRRQRGGYRIRINRQGRFELHRSNFVFNYLGGKQRQQRRFAAEDAARKTEWEFPNDQ